MPALTAARGVRVSMAERDDFLAPPRIALYARTSTVDKQTPENQLIQLREWAKGKPGTFTEHAEQESTRKTRPIKEAVMRDLRTGKLDGVVVVALSRWGRSTTELVGELRELHELDRQFISLKEGINLDTAGGRAMVGMLAVFAEFERDLAQERVLAGLERARREGKTLGWPKGKPRGPLQNRGGHAPRAETGPMTGVIDSTNVFKVT